MTTDTVNKPASTFATAGAVVALAVLAALALLAASSATSPTPADKVTLLFLALSATLCMLTPLRRALEGSADGATFALMAAFFVIYSLARRAGPDAGWELPLQLMKDSPVVVPWAARLAVAGALVATLAGRPRISAPSKGVLAALVAVTAICCFIYKFLGRFYAVSILSTVNPELLVHTLLQVVEYASVALLCNAVSSQPATRRLALRALPAVLFLLWARHQFGPAPVEDDE